ncbi:MAG: response regulator [Candidatus Omnitrophica bacterium]|nr:response regulator [Candidatus Omnitrophota bacterium]MCB9747845.1 response regulator [Candidatus Omnitrophota bacterium]
MPKNILVVDDEQEICELIQSKLKREGYSVDVAYDGKEALEKVAQQAFDLIITDVVMPELDGFHLYLELKKNEATASIPVIIVTARSQMEDSFLAVGVDSFVTKPFKSDHLVELIKKILAGKPILNLRSADFNRGAKIVKDYEIYKKYVLIAGNKIEALEFMSAQLESLQCFVEKAETAQDVLESSLRMEPDILLLDVQMEDVSAYEIINQFREFRHVQMRILLYSFFQKLDEARDSAAHFLYSNNLKKDFEDWEIPPYYLGAFNKATFKETIQHFINQ